MNGVSEETFDNIEEIKSQARQVFDGLWEAAELSEGEILVVGCSSSEVAGHRIGSWSSEEIGKALFETFYEACREKGISLAAQCCEHLNRAVILPREAAGKYGFPMVNVVPQLKAGGSFATAAYEGLPQAVAVEEVKAQAGIDIGDTLIGMHLQAVAVPVRMKVKAIGSAHVVCARTRLKYIGGQRAAYSEKLRG